MVAPVIPIKTLYAVLSNWQAFSQSSDTLVAASMASFINTLPLSMEVLKSAKDNRVSDELGVFIQILLRNVFLRRGWLNGDIIWLVFGRCVLPCPDRLIFE